MSSRILRFYTLPVVYDIPRPLSQILLQRPAKMRLLWIHPGPCRTFNEQTSLMAPKDALLLGHPADLRGLRAALSSGGRTLSAGSDNPSELARFLFEGLVPRSFSPFGFSRSLRLSDVQCLSVFYSARRAAVQVTGGLMSIWEGHGGDEL